MWNSIIDNIALFLSAWAPERIMQMHIALSAL